MALLVVLVVGVALHEGAHAAAALMFGADVELVAVMPGLTIYPELSWIPWDGWIAVVRHGPLDSDAQEGVVLLAGSMANAIAAYLALAVLGCSRPRGLAALLLFVAALLLGFDIINYTFLPAIGLRHWVFVGGAQSETLAAAGLLGLDQPAFFVAGVTAHAIALCAWGLYLLRDYRRPGATVWQAMVGSGREGQG